MTDILMAGLSQAITQFHFIRPLWLLAILPALLLIFLRPASHIGNSQWSKVIDPQLLQQLLEKTPGRSRRTPQLALLFAALVGTVALAGPTWEKIPQPVFRNQQALVIMLDQSYSMAAADVSPSRSERARQKITDILNIRGDGQTALLVYAGDAHTVTPLTDDADTIRNLLPSLSPYIMPQPGSRPDLAIELAQKLVKDAGIPKARLLLITDGLQDKDIDRIRSVWDQEHFKLGVLAVGTTEGAPIPLPKGGFLQDNQGNIILARLDTHSFDTLKQTLDVPWRPLSLADDDWQALVGEHPQTANTSADGDDNNQRHFDLWQDQGFWLIWLLLPVCLLAFRRGAVFCVLLLPCLFHSQPASAMSWQDMWKTPDQQGAELLPTDPAAAAQHFRDPSWQGTAAYQAGDFDLAARAFASDSSANSLYNLGNALARSGKLQEALQAYDQALKQQPDMADADYNRKLVEEAIKQQQQQQQQQQQNSQNQPGQNQQGQNQQGQNQQGQNQQGQNQQGQDQQGQNQQGQNQQGQNQQGQDQQGQNQQGQNQQGQNQQGQNQQGQNQQGQDQNDNNQTEQKQATQSNDQQPDSKADSDKPQASQAQQETSADDSKTDEKNATAANRDDQPMSAEQARLQQWLNRVPDQPGKLLERKFLYQYSQQKHNTDSEDVLW
jgi:Ca-activated chloride channel homolog